MKIVASSGDSLIALLVLGILVFLVIFFWINYLIAKNFYMIAQQKGYAEGKYFHFCFWLGLVGYLMVIALPDRAALASKEPSFQNRQQTNAPDDELPEL